MVICKKRAFLSPLSTKFSMCLVMLLSILLSTLLGTSKSQALEFAVPDGQFQKCLSELAKKNQWTQPEDFTAIECHSADIRSLQGVEQFKNIDSLSLYNNQLEKIDIDFAQLAKLKTLNLARNKLEEVALANMKSLETLYVFANRLKSLQLTNLANLQTLKANNNAITVFSYDNTPQLNKIYIFNNELDTINIYDLPALQYMDCRENPMPDELYDEMDRMDGVTFLHDGNAEDW